MSQNGPISNGYAPLRFAWVEAQLNGLDVKSSGTPRAFALKIRAKQLMFEPGPRELLLKQLLSEGSTGSRRLALQFGAIFPVTPSRPSAYADLVTPHDKASFHHLAQLDPSTMYEVFEYERIPSPIEWSEKLTAIAWWLHPPQSIPAFKTRALSPVLPLKARKDALTAIGFNTGADAAQAMLAIAEALGSSPAANTPEAAVKDTALWWLLNRKNNVWKDHGLAAALKEKGIYDPDKIVLTAVSLPDPPPAAFTVEDALKLTGDATRGAAVSQRCYMCHQFGGNGAEVGPDMTTWGRTQGTEVILRSLIDPSADIAHGFAGTRLETTDNLLIDGLILTDGDPVVIRSMGGLTQTVPKAKVKSKKPLGRSLMMSASQLGLTPQECADLAAFLRK